MSSKSRRKRRERGPERPSLFFIIALIVGVIFLVWIAIQVIRRPVTPPKHSANSYGSVTTTSGFVG